MTANCVGTESDINENANVNEASQVHCSMQTTGLLDNSNTGQSDSSVVHSIGKPVSASKDSSFGDKPSGHTPVDKKPSINMVQKPEIRFVCQTVICSAICIMKTGLALSNFLIPMTQI